ncbi:MAG: hypothetical protein K9K39_04405, partial [Desulfohalobiaceae bacterium]|nr:hypothetical protein [Desulfohalobiaceae bacterium]
LEQRLQEISKQYGTRILGPNTLGVFQPENKLDTIFVEHGDQALAGGGGVSFISQSGSVGVEALGLASNTGFGMRAFVGLGNKCDLNELDFLRYFERDSRTTCLAFYLESLDQGRNFLEEAERTARKKPVVILKAGSSETGASAVSSHTGRLGGSNRVISGAFRQYGIQMARDDEELCDAAKTLSELPPPSGNKVALLTPAGGYGVMGADYVESKKERIQLVMAELRESSKQRIQRASFPFAAVNNPVDLTASVTDNMMGEALQCLLEDPGVDIIICTAFFAPPGLSEDLVTIIGNLVAYSNKPIIVFTQYGPFTDRYLLKFHEAGIVGFPSMSRAIRAARLLVERAEILKSFPA